MSQQPPSLSAEQAGLQAPLADRKAVVLSALVIALGTLLSRVLGLFRDMLTARYFPNDVRDAFVNAFRLPNLFRRVFGEGSLSVSFIPVFVGVIAGRPDRGDREARELVSGVFSILLSITITVSLLAIVFMDEVLQILLSGESYLSVPGKFALTVDLGRITFGFLVLISLYGYFMAILNGLRKFVATSLAPCFFNVAMIAAALVSPRLAAPVYVLAWSVIVGGVLQVAVLLPSVFKSGYIPLPTLDWGSPEIWRVVKRFVPSAFGVSILQITALVNMRFASELESGSHSYLYLADRILELPLSLFVVSISSALLPTLAHHWAERDREAMGSTINHYMRLIVFVALPAAIGMCVLAQPIAEVLFMGREFKYSSAVATANIIRIYSLAVIFVSGSRILAQGFYAIENVWFPAVAALVTLVSHVLFAFALTRAFRLEGLAAASVASALVNLLMLATAYNSWVGKLELRRLFVSLAKFAVCAAVMAGVLQVYGPFSRKMAGLFWGSRATALLLTIAFAASIYMVCARLLRVAEFQEVWSVVRAKLVEKWARLFKGDVAPTP